MTGNRKTPLHATMGLADASTIVFEAIGRSSIEMK
jgi:hypothetical protein